MTNVSELWGRWRHSSAIVAPLAFYFIFAIFVARGPPTDTLRDIESSDISNIPLILYEALFAAVEMSRCFILIDLNYFFWNSRSLV